MRWFKRKKKEKPEVVEKPPEEDPSILESPISTQEEPVLPETSIVSLTNPVHAFIQRLNDMLMDSDFIAKAKTLKETRLQMIVGGEPLLLSKTGVNPLSLTHERSTRSDVFIRLSENAAEILAMTSGFTEFKKAYKKMVGVTGAASYISIKLHTPLDELRAKGYFSIELLRTLIDA